METWIIIGLGLSAITGALLAVIGLTGHRVDDRPRCRACRFDLSGLGPEPLACPECGRSLAGARARVFGTRRRRKGPLWLSAPLLLAPLTAIGFGVWAGATGYDWFPHAPGWALESVSRSADLATQRRAVSELNARLLDGRLGLARSERLIASGLELQADHASPWSDEWGELLEIAIRAGLCDQHEIDAYVTNSVEARLDVRATVEAGRPIPGGLELLATRVGPTSRISSASTTWMVDVDGVRRAESDPEAQWRSFRGGLRSEAELLAFKNRERARLGVSLEPGEHTIRAAETAALTAHVAGLESPVATISGEFSATARVNAVPPGSPLCSLRSGRSLDAGMAAAFDGEGVSVGRSASGETWVRFGVDNPPENFGFEILIRRGEEDRPTTVGEVFVPAGESGSRGIGTDLDVRPGALVDVVFRCSERALLGRSDAEIAWGGELVFPGLVVLAEGATEPSR